MILIETEEQLIRVNLDVRVRMRHHVPVIQRVADILIPALYQTPLYGTIQQ